MWIFLFILSSDSLQENIILHEGMEFVDFVFQLYIWYLE